jgi:arylsulfatase A
MAARPSFIIVMADDLGYGDLGCDGGSIIRTPCLDQMAAEGIRFTDFYASANVCTPSRAGLLTGRYAIRMNLAQEVIQAAESRGLPLSELTIPKLLKSAYATALFGKWHLGHTGEYWPPNVHGFDCFRGLPYSHDMKPLSYFEKDGSDAVLTESAVDFPKLTKLAFDETLAFAARNREQPFFILTALTAPHVPLIRNDEKEWDSPAGAYGDVVEEIDRNMGRLFAGLQELGLDESTLVIFTSDNGPWFEGSSGQFRDRKGGAGWDGGYRVPFIVRQPGTVPAGRVSTALASNLDLLPTLAAMAGLEVPQDVELDGKDLSQVILSDAESPHDQILLFNNTRIAAVRTRDWKFVIRTYYRGLNLPLDKLGYSMLFDLAQDPGENYNVASLHPDVAAKHAQLIDAAKAKYEPMVDLFPPYVRSKLADVHPD